MNAGAARSRRHPARAFQKDGPRFPAYWRGMRPRPLLFALSLYLPRLTAVAGEPPVVFNRDILPILSENCYYCHGQDAKQRKADLRLDKAEEALRVKDGVATIKPGDPAASDLYRRLITHEADDQMPPPKSNRVVTPQQVALIKRWIEEGAPWGKHWAFEPLARPEPPVPGNPIDAFVGAVLAKEELTFSPEAPKAALLRRVSLDLTGLPPSPQELAEYLADPAPDAYEKAVDRLLASETYGERMAWDWLDAARYADSNGYQGDSERTMWPWRDWVVSAFNRNLPFDEFTVWQVAGDLLPNATLEQKLATGFNRNHPINGEGGRIPEENRVDYVMDMAETTGTVWLGLTMNCCRCHDHKYDPLTQRDYYSLYAFFNQTPVDGSGGDPRTPPVVTFTPPTQEARLQTLAAESARWKETAAAREKELAPGREAWEQKSLAVLAPSAWETLKPETLRAEHQALSAGPDNRVLASGPNPRNDTYTLTFQTDQPRLTALRLEAFRHPSMTHGALARSDSGNFVLTEIEVSLQRPGEAQARRLKIGSAEATYEQGGLPVTAAFDGNPKSGWAIYEGRPVDREHQAVFRFDQPVPAGPGSRLTVVLRHDSVNASHNLGHFRLSAGSGDRPGLKDGGDDLSVALRTPEATRTDAQRKVVTAAFYAADPAWREASDRGAKLAKETTALQESTPKVMVMADMDKPRKTRVLDHGLYDKPGDEVTAAVPATLPALPPGVPANRLALARWLVAPEQPLTARVTVNRFWQQVFGTGLVKTSEDFGVQSEIPKHLDLLNWLAAEFRDSHWNVKALMRLIVTSRAYRQSSKVSPAMVARDPANRLLARGPRYRMPSWMLRDNALAVSGLLTRKTGGPPVNSYQPAGVWEEATFGAKKYTQDKGEALYRRSIYTFWRRIVGPTLFFDNAARQVCTVKPLRTNTPLHALTTLNDVTFVEAARVLAEHVLKTGGDTDERRLARLFQAVLARDPSPQEREVLQAALARTLSAFQAAPSEALRFLENGDSKRDASLDPALHAAWAALSLSVMNLDEAVTKE